MNKEKSTELYYKEGSSDKVYKATLEPEGKGWVVNFAYGRRGNTMTIGTKTAKPVEYDDAVEIYQKLIMSKTRKGYVPDPSGAVFQ